MKKTNKKIAMFLIGTIALSGLGASTLGEVYSKAIVVQASGNEFSSNNGIVVMGTGPASITITGNEDQSMDGKKFRVYKLFAAQNSEGGESINYTFNPLYEQALKNVVADELNKSPQDITEYMVIDYIQSLNTNPVEGTQTEQTLEGSYSEFRYFVEAVRDEIESLNVTGSTVIVKDTKNDNSIQLSGLEYGYYIIDEISSVSETHSASSLCMVDTANPSAAIAIKSDYPTIIKKIQEDDASKDISDADGWNDIADYEIGQTVPYKFESDIPDINGYDAYYYAWHDKMDSALSFNADSVKIIITGELSSGKEKSYTLATGEYSVITNPGNNETFKVEVNDIKEIVDREFNRMNTQNENIYGQSVVLEYEAVLNENASSRTGRSGFENDVRLEFSNNPDTNGKGSTGYTPWDTVVCFTYKINVRKTNNYNLELEGAKFRLYSDEKCENEVYVKKGEGGYIVINRDVLGGEDHTGGIVPAEAVEMVSASDGAFTIFGLDQGTYYLQETEAPDGYRTLLDPIVIQVTPVFTNERDSYVKGQGATTEILQELNAVAYIESFYDGLKSAEEKTLTTDAEEGALNLTVINKVGMKLPVTGTPELLIITLAGSCVMIGVVLHKKKRGKSN